MFSIYVVISVVVQLPPRFHGSGVAKTNQNLRPGPWPENAKIPWDPVPTMGESSGLMMYASFIKGSGTLHPVGWDEVRWMLIFEGLPWETWKTHKLILAEWRNAAAKIAKTNALVAMLSCVKISGKNQFSNTRLGKVLLLLGRSLESCWVLMLQPSKGQSLRFLLKWMHCSYTASVHHSSLTI